MLKIMRKYSRSYLIKIIFGVIILSFVIYFGAGSIRDKDVVMGEVGGFKITEPEWRDSYHKELEMLRQIYRDKMDDKMANELKEKVFSDMINQYVLLNEAKKLGISVSDREFSEVIGSEPAFQKDGKFNKDQYLAVLRQNKLDPEQFEKGQRTMLVLRKVISVITDTGAPVTEAAIWAGYVREKGKIDLVYTRFDAASFRSKVTVSEKELNDSYDKEKEKFRGENTYRLKYIVIDGSSSVTDNKAYDDLLKGKDLDAYGRQKGFTVSDTGTVSESELFKKYKGLKIETWIRDLRKGDVSLPARGDGKSYIFQLIEYTAGKPMDKNEALAKIKDRLTGDKAKGAARLAAEDAIKGKATGSQRTGFVSRTAASLPKIGNIPAGDKNLLGLSKDNPVYSKPVEIDGDFYVFCFAGEQEPDRQEWAQHKEGFARYYMAKSKDQFIRDYVEESRQAMLKQGKIKIVKNPKEF